MKRHFKYMAIVVMLFQPMLYGQQPTRVHGLSGSPLYDSLIMRYDEMSLREQNIELRLQQAREHFASGRDDSNTLAGSIIGLETDLFRLRDSLENLSGRITAMEQERLTSSGGGPLTSGSEPAQTGAAAQQVANIVSNSIFSENMSAADYALLCSQQNEEAGVTALLADLRENYYMIRTADSLYRDAPKETADSTLSVLEGYLRKGDDISSAAEDKWSSIFETKVYLYNLFLDKTGQSGALKEMERQMERIRLQTDEVRGMYMYDAAAIYPFQKSLLLKYELTIAALAGLDRAADSLRGAAPNALLLDNYLLPAITVEERLFLDYSDIDVARPAKYSSSGQIPATEVHPKGTIFRLLLGIYGKPQPVSIFKGIFPLSVQRKEDGKYYYYAGGYASYEEADAGVAKAKRLGMSNPRIAVWHNGEYSQPPTGQNSPNSEKISTGVLRYRIEISGAPDGLPSDVRAFLEKEAPGREISRVVDGVSGEVKFTVGSFDDIAGAEKVAGELNSLSPALIIIIFSVP